MLSERICYIIEAKKIKKVDFAKRLNISQPFVSELCSGAKVPSDRTITAICREFDVREAWLRTGEGDPFIEKSREESITAFMGSIMSGEPDFRQRFISVLARMTSEEWAILEKKVLELAEEIKKADP